MAPWMQPAACLAVVGTFVAIDVLLLVSIVRLASELWYNEYLSATFTSQTIPTMLIYLVCCLAADTFGFAAILMAHAEAVRVYAGCAIGRAILCVVLRAGWVIAVVSSLPTGPAMRTGSGSGGCASYAGDSCLFQDGRRGEPYTAVTMSLCFAMAAYSLFEIGSTIYIYRCADVQRRVAHARAAPAPLRLGSKE